MTAVQLITGVSRQRVAETDPRPYLAGILKAAAAADHYRSHAADLRTLEDFPVLTRADLAAHADDLLVPGIPKPLRKWVTTGGSTGKPVGFWLDRSISASEWAFMTAQWSRIGYKRTSLRVVLRGRLMSESRPISYGAARRELRLSTFRLDEKHLPLYLRAIERMPRAFLHAYPSTALRLLTLCEQAGRAVPRFLGLLLGSEQVSAEQRDHLSHRYGAPVFSWYGQSEKILLGGECQWSRSYHLFPTYGVAELLDDDGAAITAPGRMGRLVGTGLLNLSAPLVRYETGDMATWAVGPCSCGFDGQRLEFVAGRVQDALRTPAGAQLSLAALNLHSRAYDRVGQLQYEQLAPDRVVVRVISTPLWTVEDQQRLQSELAARLPGVCVEVRVVDHIAPELNGKTPVLKPRP